MWKHKTFFNTSGDDYASAEENLVKFLNKENPEIISVTTSTSGYHSFDTPTAKAASRIPSVSRWDSQVTNRPQSISVLDSP